MRIEPVARAVALGAAVVIGLLASVIDGAGQAPLFLVDESTTVDKVGFRFVSGRSLDLGLIDSETALDRRSAARRLQGALAWLPLIDEPAAIQFQPLELQKDVARLRRLYRQMGFPEADVSYDVQLDTISNSVDIEFVVDEGPPRILSSVDVRIDGSVPADSLLPRELRASWNELVASLGSRTGSRFGEMERQSARTLPLRWARDRGYAFATVEDSVVIESAGLAAEHDIALSLGPRARVDSIAIDGNRALETRVVVRELPFRTGDWYSASRVSEGQRQIFGLELVRLALADMPEQPVDSAVLVRYRIEEGRPRLLSGELGYSSASGIRTRTDWTHRDFLGSARTLTATAEARSAWLALEGSPSQTVGGSLTLRQPYLGDRRVSGTISPFVEYRDGIVDRSWVLGMGVGVLWEKAPLETVSVEYRSSRRTVLEVRAGLEGIGQAGFIDALAALDSLEVGASTSVFSLSTTQGRVDDPLNPHRGWIVRADARVAGPASVSSVEYLRGQLDVIGFLPVSDRVGLSLRAGGGRLRPFGVSTPTPQSDTLALLIRLRDGMLTAGGTQSVRGWGSGLLGPKLPNFRLTEVGDSIGLEADRYVPFAGLARLTTSAELSLPLPFAESDHGSFVFLDGGRVWNPDERFGGGGPDPLGQENFFWSTGAGLRFETLVGAVRLSVGYKLNPSLLDLRDARDVAQALASDLPITSIPPNDLRRFHLHITIGRGI